MSPSTVIKEPNKYDVLAGRGRSIRLHEGNRRFTDLIHEFSAEYESAPKGRKMEVVKRVVDAVHSVQGRFLQKNDEHWEEVDKEKAIVKTAQAFRDLRVEESPSPAKKPHPVAKIKQFDYSLLKKHAPAGRYTALLNDTKPKAAVTDEADGDSSSSSSSGDDSGSEDYDDSKSGSEESGSSSEEEKDQGGDVSETETEDSFPIYRGPKGK